jgi:GNAT superfamily N-acetyltransferase
MPGVDDAVSLPDRFTTRSLTMTDVDVVFDLIVACEIAASGVADIDREDVRADWSRPGFDLSVDAIAVVDGDRMVATAEVFKNRADVNVHPDHERRGVGTWLLSWTEARSRELGRPNVGQTLDNNHAAAIEILKHNGYGYGHTSWMLEIEIPDRPAEPEPPAGIEVRTFRPGTDDDATYRVVEDAFNEWPNREPATFEEWSALTIRRHDFDPDLLQLAVDGDHIVGVAFSIAYPDSGGWVQQLAVAATHRHRGIARALLHRAFATAWDRGDRRCGLSTDSRTGALGLYEKVGMHVTRSFTNHVKSLDPAG